MGDAEDAQLNGFQQVSEFEPATYLLCFFHVLYNVRKRTKHLAPKNRIVMDGIVKMHYTENMTAYYTDKDSVLSSWRAVPELEAFVKYFSEQWLDSRYWQWQVFHTPIGYATTNYPCETFNAVLKKYTRRRRYHMQQLLTVTFTVVGDIPKRSPKTESDILPPSTVVTKAASSTIATGRLVVFATDNPALCRVKQIRKDEDQSAGELEELCSVIDQPFRVCPDETRDENQDTLLLCEALLVREQRARAAQLYKNAISWSLLFAHITSMPEGVDKCICGCKFFNKFKSCCHILAGRKVRRLGRPGGNAYAEKLFDRHICKKPAKPAKRQRTQPPCIASESTDPIPLELTRPGRTPYASRALDVQFLLCPDT